MVTGRYLNFPAPGTAEYTVPATDSFLPRGTVRLKAPDNRKILRPLQAEGEKNITISDIKYIDIDGNTYVYIITKENEIYRQKVSENEELLFLEPGDKITVSYNGKEMISFQENNR